MWTNDYVQFGRLIVELDEAGVFTDDLIGALPMSSEDVHRLRKRAAGLWDDVQEHANPAAWIEENFGLYSSDDEED